MIASGMDHAGIVSLFRLVVVLALLLWFVRNFRGGRPPTPMHPSPADDSALLRKRRSKLRIEDNEIRISALKSRLERSRQRLRKFVKPGRLLSDELIAERRGAAKRE